MTLPRLSTVQSADSHRTTATTVNAIMTKVASVSTDAVFKVSTRAEMADIGAPTAGIARFVTESGYQGLFVFDDSDLSANVDSDTCIAPSAASGLATDGTNGAWVRSGFFAGNLTDSAAFVTEMAGSTKWSFLGKGNSPSAFVGHVRIGDNTVPTEALEVVGNIKVTGVYKVGSVQVVGAQRTAIADDASGAANQGTVNAILAALRAHGLIAT